MYFPCSLCFVSESTGSRHFGSVEVRYARGLKDRYVRSKLYENMHDMDHLIHIIKRVNTTESIVLVLETRAAMEVGT